MSSDSSEENLTFYGDPLDEIDEDTLPRKKAITVEDQFAKDDQGRRRFHGAFTGGFSAGYYNSVGSQEGWKPSTFISSRNNRNQAKDQSVFDFMDDEDKGEHGICPLSVKVRSNFDDKTADTLSRKRDRIHTAEKPLASAPVIKQILSPVHDTVGIKLLMKMGWKPGQGIGPRLTLKEKALQQKKSQSASKIYCCDFPTEQEILENDNTEETSTNLDDVTFAPEDYQSFIVNPKQNCFGLGYKGMNRQSVLSSNRSDFSKLTVNGKTIRGQAFGVSVFEDDDDDIYNVEDMSNYDFSIGPFDEQKVSKKKFYDTSSQCIEGFHVAIKPLKSKGTFSLPVIPEDFVPLKNRKFRWDSKTKVSKNKVASADERNKIIGDVSEPSAYSGNNQYLIENAKSEASKKITEGVVIDFRLNETDTSSSFKPFATDPEKQMRYEKFLNFRKFNLTDCVSSLFPSTMTEWEKVREKTEFEQAANIYRPLSGDMANRFTIGSQENVHDILTPVEKTIDSDFQTRIEAAKKKMYGSLTRRKFSWFPHSILCKRFNVPEPFKGTLQNSAEVTKKENKKSSIFDFMETKNFHYPKTDGYVNTEQENQNQNELAVKNTEKIVKSNEIKNKIQTDINPENESEEHSDEELSNLTEKIDLFKAIFLSSSDEESDDDNAKNVSIPIENHTENEKLQENNESKILYSPPRGIFSNINLESLKPNFPQSKINEKSKSVGSKDSPMPVTTDLISERNIALSSENNTSVEQIYGPKLPTFINSSKSEFSFKKENKAHSDKFVWVEKSSSHHKKHRKMKKKRKHKHK